MPKRVTSLRAQCAPRGGDLRHNYCDATILLAIAFALHLFLNGFTEACAASILAILSAIAIQIRSGMILFH